MNALSYPKHPTRPTRSPDTAPLCCTHIIVAYPKLHTGAASSGTSLKRVTNTNEVPARCHPSDSTPGPLRTPQSHRVESALLLHSKMGSRPSETTSAAPLDPAPMSLRYPLPVRTGSTFLLRPKGHSAITHHAGAASLDLGHTRGANQPSPVEVTFAAYRDSATQATSGSEHSGPAQDRSAPQTPLSKATFFAIHRSIESHARFGREPSGVVQGVFATQTPHDNTTFSDPAWVHSRCGAHVHPDPGTPFFTTQQTRAPQINRGREPSWLIPAPIRPPYRHRMGHPFLPGARGLSESYTSPAPGYLLPPSRLGANPTNNSTAAPLVSGLMGHSLRQVWAQSTDTLCLDPPTSDNHIRGVQAPLVSGPIDPAPRPSWARFTDTFCSQVHDRTDTQILRCLGAPFCLSPWFRREPRPLATRHLLPESQRSSDFHSLRGLGNLLRLAPKSHETHGEVGQAEPSVRVPAA